MSGRDTCTMLFPIVLKHQNMELCLTNMSIKRITRKALAAVQRVSRSLGDETNRIFPEDVFLVSYPRSGNTWMRYLLANLLEPNVDWNITNIGKIIPDLYERIPEDYAGVQPRIFKSHEPFCDEYPRVIYLYRDGRDVSISYYDFYVKLKGYQGDFAQFLSRMLQGDLPYGSWQDHVSSWLFRDEKKSFLAISYEKLYGDTQKELERVGTFLELSWAESEVRSAIAKSTLEKQKNDFYRYKQETHWQQGFRGGVKGAPGKWREIFDESLNALYWQYAGQVAEKVGYSRQEGMGPAPSF
jgi:estrone sulfotransferase